MKWVRVDCTLDDHPDILEAGWQARDVFEALLRTSKKFDLGGVIPAKFGSPSYLSRQLGMDRSLMIIGLENAARVGLIESDTEGNVCIPGWDEFNGEHELREVRDKAKIRKQRQREREKEAMSRDGHVTVTGQNVTGRDCHDVTGDGTGRDGTGRDGTEQGIISPPTGSHPANEVAGVHVPEVKVPTKHLIAEWNRIAAPAGAVHCRAFAPASETNMRARWIEAGKDDSERLATFLAQYTAIAASPLCTGRVESKNGGRSWRAGLDWLVRPTNWAKVANGNYAAGPAREGSAVRLARRMGIFEGETGGKDDD